ncbi:hypothetical protein ZWY2020_037653 [Hordeum vulgare]|nr:hypothetical protein ZWY2020_037653 [Hordeum vulgare]
MSDGKDKLDLSALAAAELSAKDKANLVESIKVRFPAEALRFPFLVLFKGALGWLLCGLVALIRCLGCAEHVAGIGGPTHGRARELETKVRKRVEVLRETHVQQQGFHYAVLLTCVPCGMDLVTT